MNKLLRFKIIKEYGSQANFSMKVVESETLISKIVNGRRSLPPERQAVWANLLVSDVSELFGNQEGCVR